jgi:hypothetical protein
MSYWTGTLLASPIVRGSSGDTYGTHHSILGVGGYMEVNSIAERNLLPIDSVNGIGYDGISSGQRRIGMLVYVHADDTIYKLDISQSTWTGLTSAGKLTALANNSNWSVFVAGGDDTPSGDRIVKEFEQLTHGFIVGDVIGYNGTDFLKVSSLTAANVEPLGLVTSVIDANNFRLTFSGYISTAGITDVYSSGLTGGTMYYLSSTAGKIIASKPTGSTEISKPVLVALSADTGVVLQYRGIYEDLTSGGTVSWETFTGYTATTQLFLDKTVTGATNIGFFTGQTGIQTLPITHITESQYSGDYASVYNHYYRDSNGYVRIGPASDNELRRGYLRTTNPPISWIWNEYTGNSNPIGWVFLNADITLDTVYGAQFTGTTDVGYATPAYTAVTWADGTSYNNGSNIIISTTEGSLTTGSTYLIGGPIYSDKQDKELRLRTVVSKTPEAIKVEYDDYFIKLSGSTGGTVSAVQNVGTGIGVYSGTSGTTILLKSLIGGGDTCVLDNGNQIIITSTGGGGTGGSGEAVEKLITQASHGFSTGEAIGWCSGTYSKAIADGTYDGEILGLVSSVVNTNQFVLTQSGYITGQTGLVTNSTYFVSPTVAGNIQITAPTTVGELVRPILVADSTTTGWVLPYPGYEITPPITGGTGGTGGSIYYTGATPSAIEVGGIGVGTTLTGKTFTDLFEEMLVPELCGTVTAPSIGVNLSASGLYEIDCNLSQTVTGNFSRGSINPQYCSVSPFRSGLPNAYCFTGTGMPSGFQSCTALSASATNASYDVLIGTQTWGAQTKYDCGEPALGSKGTEYCAKLPSGCTTTASNTIVGVYPLWATQTSISSIDKISPLYNMSSANNICIEVPAESGGNKQKFEIPCAWLGAPTSRPLVGVCQWNTVSSQWEYPGGSAACSLNLWTASSTTENVQGNTIGYCQYTHACGDRGSVCIRLVF